MTEQEATLEDRALLEFATKYYFAIYRGGSHEQAYSFAHDLVFKQFVGDPLSQFGNARQISIGECCDRWRRLHEILPLSSVSACMYEFVRYGNRAPLANYLDLEMPLEPQDHHDLAMVIGGTIKRRAKPPRGYFDNLELAVAARMYREFRADDKKAGADAARAKARKQMVEWGFRAPSDQELADYVRRSKPAFGDRDFLRLPGPIPLPRKPHKKAPPVSGGDKRQLRNYPSSPRLRATRGIKNGRAV